MFKRVGPLWIIIAALASSGIFLIACVTALAVQDAPTAVHQALIMHSEAGGAIDRATETASVGMPTHAPELTPQAPSLRIPRLPGQGPTLPTAWIPTHARAPPVG